MAEISRDLGGTREEDLAAIFTTAGAEYGIDPELLRALSWVESRHDRRAVSPKGAKGPFQIMPATAKAMGLEDPHNWTQAAVTAAQILREALDRNQGNLRLALMEYHGGPNRKIWGEQTSKYPDLVLAQYKPSAQASTTPGQIPKETPRTDLMERMAAELAQGPSEAPLRADEPMFRDDYDPKIWGSREAWLNSLTLGGYKPLSAAYWAAGRVARDEDLRGAPREEISRAHELAYQKRMNELDKYMKGYQEEEGLGSLVADIGGSMVPTVGALKGIGAMSRAAFAPVVRGATAVSPVLGDVVRGTGRFVAGTAGEGLPGLTGTALRGASDVVQGGIQGALATGLQSGLGRSDLPIAEQMEAGGLVGAVTNPLIAPAVRAVLPASRAVSTDELVKLSEAMRQEGVPLFGWQIASEGGVHRFGSALTPHAQTQQLHDYTGALARKLGLNQKKLTASDIKSVQDQIADEIDQTAKFVGVRGNDPDLVRDLTNIEAELAPYLQVPGAIDPKLAAGIIQQINNVRQQLSTGGILGTELAKLFRYHSPLSELGRNKDFEIGGRLVGKIKSALWDAAERFGPQQTQAFRDARTKYMLSTKLERPAIDAGAAGIINPHQIANLIPGDDPNLGVLAMGGRLMPSPTARGTAEDEISGVLERLALHYGAPIGGGSLASLGAMGFGLGHPEYIAAGLATAGGLHGLAKYMGAKMASPSYLARVISNTELGPRATVNPFSLVYPGTYIRDESDADRIAKFSRGLLEAVPKFAGGAVEAVVGGNK